MISYHCSVCGDEIETTGLTVDESMACRQHPGAVIDSVYLRTATATPEVVEAIEREARDPRRMSAEVEAEIERQRRCSE